MGTLGDDSQDSFLSQPTNFDPKSLSDPPDVWQPKEEEEEVEVEGRQSEAGERDDDADGAGRVNLELAGDNSDELLFPELAVEARVVRVEPKARVLAPAENRKVDPGWLSRCGGGDAETAAEGPSFRGVLKLGQGSGSGRSGTAPDAVVDAATDKRPAKSSASSFCLPTGEASNGSSSLGNDSSCGGGRGGRVESKRKRVESGSDFILSDTDDDEKRPGEEEAAAGAARKGGKGVDGVEEPSLAKGRPLRKRAAGGGKAGKKKGAGGGRKKAGKRARRLPSSDEEDNVENADPYSYDAAEGEGEEEEEGELAGQRTAEGPSDINIYAYGFEDPAGEASAGGKPAGKKPLSAKDRLAAKMATGFYACLALRGQSWALGVILNVLCDRKYSLHVLLCEFDRG